MDNRNIFNTRSANKDEHSLFFKTEDNLACIGYMRADFSGNDGLWHYWFDLNANLKTESFNKEFEELVNTLRKDTLMDLNRLMSYCRNHSEQKINGGYTDMYGYIMESERYRYAVRMTPVENDYQVYIFCYDRFLADPLENDNISLLEELSRQVMADVKTYRAEMLFKNVQDVYDNAYYIHIVENVGNYFEKVEWATLEQISDAEPFIRFISMKKPFLHSFMEWVNRQDGVDASTLRSMEDEIFDFLLHDPQHRKDK